MKFVADLHIHSHFSRATSPNLTFEQLTRWAQMKGLHIVGTGDATHPGWLAEMREKLAPAEEGLFRLRDDPATAVEADVPPACRGLVRFILASEISNIYKRGGQTRKIHNLVCAPSFEAVERLQARLERIGNIRADGRPILGLDSRDLLEIILDIDPACHLIPAHIWTPWFSLLGSKSGFDSVAECFGDLTPHIFALETGLSSDPPMNWRVSALDRYTLVSNSDAHSPEKLGREANLFDCELVYSALFDALQTRRVSAPPWPGEARENPSGLAGPYLGTIEFFPEEGKYHFDGHRNCGIRWDPATTLAHGGICPRCGREVTVGVMHRVEALADRPIGGRPAHTSPFVSLIPLPEVLGEIFGVGESSKQVQAEYIKLLGRLGSELVILRETPLEEIAQAGGGRLAEAIGRMRRGEVLAQPGYDGEYGVIRVFGGANVSESQMGLFGEEPEGQKRKTKGALGGRERESEEEQRSRVAEARVEYAAKVAVPIPNTQYPSSLLAGLNDQQRAAVLCTDAPLVIVAGPGTGKTRTLTVRIAYLILAKGVAPENILAITFTNKAAGEMRERLEGLLDSPKPLGSPETLKVSSSITIKTFHAFGALLLREYAGRLGLSPEFVILADEDRLALLRQACPELKAGEVDDALVAISAAKNGALRVDSTHVPGTFESAWHVREVYHRYDAALRAGDAVDFDDLILLPIRLLEEHPDVLAAVQARYRWISVDEYQDVNAAQYRLLRLLTAPPSPQPWGEQTHPPELGGRGANLCVIGDPDQAIYGFRGADPRYFLQFEQDYPGAVRLSLSRNYRSSQAILDAAAQVIARNPDRKAVEILAQFADEVRLDIYRAATDKAEAEYVVHQIEQMVGGTSYFSLDSARVTGETPATARSFADFAVLYRLSAQSRPLIEAFDRSGIPYQTVGQAPLTSHKAVREVLAHLWLLYNPRSQVHVAQVGNLRYSQELAQARQAGEPVARLIEQSAAQIARQRRKPYDDTDAQRLHQLALRAVPFGDRLADFLEVTALQSETDAYDPRADRVTLMTLHAAKGLEFPVVFIVGCEEGLLPYERKGEAVDVAEERRLFYVGLTRAGRKLILTHAAKRVLFGQFMENPPSRFVGDIEAALKEIQEMKYRRPERKEESKQLSLF
jgi:DNA helicase-2/ATP-dependent DNA helicase PcrA